MRESLKDFEKELRNRPGGLSNFTIRGYLDDIRKFVWWFQAAGGDEMEPGKVTAPDVLDYRDHLQAAANFKPATINRRLSSLRAYFSWAVEEGLAGENPVRVRNVEQELSTPRPLQEKDYRKLLRQAQKHGRLRDVAILQLLRHTGIRLGELCNLTLADVEISGDAGKVIVRPASVGKRREVPLNRDARQALQSYLEEERPAVDDPHLFIGQRRNGLTDAAVQNAIKKYAGLAGLEGASPQLLRDTFACSLLERGVELHTVQRLMGHKRPESTARYAGTGDPDLEAAVARLEKKEAVAPKPRPARPPEEVQPPQEKSEPAKDERTKPKWKQW